MITESIAQFLPSGKGYKGSYALTFLTDLSHLIYLLCTNQGVEIPIKSIVVDNSMNASACTVNMRGDSIICPPYTIKTIDTNGALDVSVIATANSVSIKVDVLTIAATESTVVKKVANVGGKPPISFTDSGTTSVNIWTKIVSLTSGVTSYVNFGVPTGTGTSTSWSLNGGTTVYGAVSIGGSIVIDMDGAVQELWIRVIGNPFTSNQYVVSGG